MWNTSKTSKEKYYKKKKKNIFFNDTLYGREQKSQKFMRFHVAIWIMGKIMVDDTPAT